MKKGGSVKTHTRQDNYNTQIASATMLLSANTKTQFPNWSANQLIINYYGAVAQ